jgi:acyl-CoA reductase-like NAD-dependent aldehyde dehydrogenase
VEKYGRSIHHTVSVSEAKSPNFAGVKIHRAHVWVNSHFDVAPNAPFGGHKQSGMGVEWGLDGLLVSL